MKAQAHLQMKTEKCFVCFAIYLNFNIAIYNLSLIHI